MNVIINGKIRTFDDNLRDIEYSQLCLEAGISELQNPSITYHHKNGQLGGIVPPGLAGPLTDGIVYNVAVTGDA